MKLSVLRSILILILFLFSYISAFSQTSNTAGAPQSADESTPMTIFNHSGSSRLFIAGQANIIFQYHPPFPAKYSGDNSMRATTEHATSRLFTLYTGLQLTRFTEILFDVESTGGKGISDALGLAGFTNLDVVRNPSLSATPYIARVMLHQIIPLSHETEEAERSFLSLATRLPVRRLELRMGKFGTVDFFDQNSVGSDSHLQFMNWTVDNNGAYDYAADTRGYTYGVEVEYQDRNWGVRFAECLMPKVANGLSLDWNVSRARSENFEVEFRHNFISNHPGVVRLLAYANHADMGSYRETIDAFLSKQDVKPDITAHRRQGRIKYGFGVNLEQEVSSLARVFFRVGWNEGHNESFAYTEVDNTILLGGDWRGSLWGREQDKVGAAFVSNGISKDHRQYLTLGGDGFLLGDGRLTYGREIIFETYYNLHIWRGISTAFDFQFIKNPGYNEDRGPVEVLSLRLHIDL